VNRPWTAIDWGAPWLQPLAPWGRRLAPDAAGVSAALQGLAEPGLPRFVPPDRLPPDTAYESHIAATGEVPTRDNGHDLFNGLVWLWQPVLKRRLNQLQAQSIGRDGVGPVRGPLRDALTLFDENGALWLEPDTRLLHALRQRDWHGLFVEHRARWAGQRLEIVGHALLEQLSRAPRKPLTAHVLAAVDPLSLDEAGWSGKPFLPLPVLGIPGWWPGQDAPDFYADPKVFRRPAALKDAPKP
jgi:Protein of unknown function (DUF3025)